MGESIDQVKNELYELMRKETIWCEGKVLSLSQKLDKLINLYYTVKSE